MTSFNFFFQGTLRVLLVLLHDFPEFLCDYHYGFCDVIPPNCVQMRNLILSAFPRNMRLPDPFTPNLKVDMLTDISLPPRILINFASKIQPAQFKKVTYLSSFLSHQAVYKHFVMQGKIFLFKLGVIKNLISCMWFSILQDLDSYLKSRSPVTFVSDLRSYLQVNLVKGMFNGVIDLLWMLCSGFE